MADMAAPAVYLVRFWVKPGGEEKLFAWLDGGHLKDVLSQPGFLWAQRYKLALRDAEGWQGYAIVYGVESIAKLEAYFASPATRQYAEERKALGLDALLKMDRNWGTLDVAVTR